MKLLDRVKNSLQRRSAYKDAFTSPSGQRILADLADFCGILKAAPYEHIERAEGRRDVYLHIVAILDMTPSDIRRIVEQQAAIEGDPLNDH
jgi:hypothetical protein